MSQRYVVKRGMVIDVLLKRRKIILNEAEVDSIKHDLTQRLLGEEAAWRRHRHHIKDRSRNSFFWW